MYKIGDKVELDNEMYVIKGIDEDLVQIINERGSRLVDISELKLYTNKMKNHNKDMLTVLVIIAVSVFYTLLLWAVSRYV
jgi:hypothetical protein